MADLRREAVARLSEGDATVAVIGLGYVGLPLAVAFADAGYRVVGIDIDPTRVETVNGGASYIPDVPDADVRRLTAAERLRATTEFEAVATCAAISVCVPTPLRKTGDPDVSYIVGAVRQMAPFVRIGAVAVLESTTYPGTTREIVAPLLLEAQPHLVMGESVFLAFSPERVDPGRTDWTTRTTPKVLGGMTPACLAVATAYYGRAIDTIVPVSSTETAEMVKLLENTFRAVNIGLANEMMLMCDRLALDVWEVIEAAATKPFGFLKFAPGPGLGGHCIPIDPLYLSWKLRTLSYTARFIELASDVNSGMPRYWVQKAQDGLNERRKALNGSRVLVVGVAYKRNVNDVRESPALDIIRLLEERGAHVRYHDPFVPDLRHEGIDLQSEPSLEDALDGVDCVLIATDHDVLDYGAIVQCTAAIVDTRNALAGRGLSLSHTRQAVSREGAATPA